MFDMESYWRGVQCRVESIDDEVREIRELISKPMTARNRNLVMTKLRNIDEVNSSNYRECEDLVAEMTDDADRSRDDISEVIELIPAANYLSQGDVMSLVELVKQWRVSMGLPAEIYRR